MTEQERIKRFETAYNRIDNALDEWSDHDRDHRRRTFASKVRIATNRYRCLQKYREFLLEIGELRNALVHNRTGDDMYLAVPSEQTVDELEEIEQKLLNPHRVFPRFQRDVEILSPDQTLADALEIVNDRGFTRFPVYSREGFLGLLTANGIVRWIARNANSDKINFDANNVRIAQVLDADHHKDYVALVSKEKLVEEIELLFNDKKPLEAVVITEHGKPHEKPLGLICPKDLVRKEK